jgi:hypothetical protein
MQYNYENDVPGLEKERRRVEKKGPQGGKGKGTTGDLLEIKAKKRHRQNRHRHKSQQPRERGAPSV